MTIIGNCENGREQIHGPAVWDNTCSYILSHRYGEYTAVTPVVGSAALLRP